MADHHECNFVEAVGSPFKARLVLGLLGAQNLAKAIDLLDISNPKVSIANVK